MKASATKVCPGCPSLGEQDIEAFYRNRAAKDGRQRLCKVCQSAAIARTPSHRKKMGLEPLAPAPGARRRRRDPGGELPAGLDPDSLTVPETIDQARGIRPANCACGARRKTKCGFPNQGRTCGEPLCDGCGHEIREGLRYCDAHHERAMRARDVARGGRR